MQQNASVLKNSSTTQSLHVITSPQPSSHWPDLPLTMRCMRCTPCAWSHVCSPILLSSALNAFYVLHSRTRCYLYASATRCAASQMLPGPQLHVKWGCGNQQVRIIVSTWGGVGWGMQRTRLHPSAPIRSRSRNLVPRHCTPAMVAVDCAQRDVQKVGCCITGPCDKWPRLFAVCDVYMFN